MIVKGFHGITRGDIEGEPRMPLYLGYTRDLAEAYGECEEGATVLEVEAEVTNPLKLDAPYRLREVLEVTGALDKDLPNWHPAGTSRVTDWALAKGFDAILIPEEAGFSPDAPYEHWEMAAGTYGEPQLILLAPKWVKVTVAA